jgi:hypothetical protein
MKMAYEDKVREILKLARTSEDPDERAALGHCLALAQCYERRDPRKAHRILDEALGGDKKDES